MNPSGKRRSESKSASVSGQCSNKQAEEDLWSIYNAERFVWSEQMLRILAGGVKGGKWFSLTDKVYSERTLSLAWQKVRSNAGACGVDGNTIEAFGKDSENRLLVVNEHLKQGSCQTICLDELDDLMERSGYAMTRYADDMTVQCETAEEAKRALKGVREWMNGIGLQLHPQKTRIMDMQEADTSFDFLGYRFKRLKSGKLLKPARPKSEQKLRESIRRQTRRNNAHSMQMIIERINPILRGWFSYFKQACRGQQRELDGWIRMRLRSIHRNRHRKRGRGRGSDHQRWPNRHFAEPGLFSPEAAQCEAIGLRNGVKH